MKSLLKKYEEMVENSPWDLINQEQKDFLDKNDLKVEEVESVYKNLQASLIQAYLSRMEENKKYLDNKKCCYLSHIWNQKPSFSEAVVMCENLDTLK